MNNDHAPYYALCSKARLDKAVNSLLGIVEGISIDSVINSKERHFFSTWLSDHDEYRSFHPYNELIPVIESAIEDDYFEEEERLDIIWLCEKFRSNEYYGTITSDIQMLHGIIGAIASDGVITVGELKNLSKWLMDHDHLKRCWPYDEIDSIITAALSDGKIDEKEHDMLISFFAEFVGLYDDKTINQPIFAKDTHCAGLCAANPDIVFENSLFCFTGASSKYPRKTLYETVQLLGGKVSNTVTSDLDYLIIGADGNPCWTYSCYGRKVEKAVDLRKKGSHLMLIHEIDFHDAVAGQID